MCDALAGDDRFIHIDPGHGDDAYLISKVSVVRWWLRLILRLARAAKDEITTRDLALSLSGLCVTGRWRELPDAVMSFGMGRGLWTRGWSENQVVLPLARLLSFTPEATRKRVLFVLERIVGEAPENALDTYRLPNIGAVDSAINRVLSQLPKRQERIVKAREGLSGPTRTLESIGKGLGLTRERVRQLEKEAWLRISHPARLPVFVCALAQFVLDRGGSLLVDTTVVDERIVGFVCKAARIPYYSVGQFLILTGENQELAELEEMRDFPDDLDWRRLADRLAATGQFGYWGVDVEHVCKVLIERWRRDLSKTQKVYLVLKEIGQPAHYSAIAEQYARMFPEEEHNERAVHAALALERYGVVWIGTKGVYGLREWGYERPTIGLFETVERIVQERYASTSKAVPMSVIMAEIGKYRRLVNETSVMIAARLNARLIQTAPDLFIPKGDHDEDRLELRAEEIDRVLQAFESASSQSPDLGNHRHRG